MKIRCSPPDGIIVTFGKQMIEDKGGLLKFLRWFESCINNPESWWNHKCKNLPKIGVAYVYILIAGRIYCRCNCGGYETGERWMEINPNGEMQQIGWNGIILTSPLIKAPTRMKIKGFKGFRYTEKLF